MQKRTPTPALELDISRLEKEIEMYSQEKYCYEAQILRVFHLSLSLSLPLHVHANIHAVIHAVPMILISYYSKFV
jgi:hypothetical protein